MSSRRSRRRRAAGKAAKAMTMYKLAKPVGGAVKAFKRGRAGKRSAPAKRKPLALVAGLLGIAGLAAAMRKRKHPDDLGYGPPNESHPSHETLAPSRAAAATGQAGNGGPAGEGEPAAEPAGPSGDEAGTDDPGREERSESESAT